MICEVPLVWRDPNDSKPPALARVAVILMVNGHFWTTMAEYVPPHTIKGDDYLDEDARGDSMETYDKIEDDYYVNEGWFESSVVSENKWVLGDPVLWWADVQKPEGIKP